MYRPATQIAHDMENIMQRNRIGDVAIVTVANFEMREVVQKWLLGLASHQYGKFVVVCLYRELLQFLHNGSYAPHAILVPTEWTINDSSSNFDQQKVSVWYHLQGVPFFFAYFLVNLFLQLETNMVM